jgi:hypothetical protein
MATRRLYVTLSAILVAGFLVGIARAKVHVLTYITNG